MLLSAKEERLIAINYLIFVRTTGRSPGSGNSCCGTRVYRTLLHDKSGTRPEVSSRLLHVKAFSQGHTYR